jgi:Lrp/AsnC family leucine-responsive transcriptional regulator
VLMVRSETETSCVEALREKMCGNEDNSSSRKQETVFSCVSKGKWRARHRRVSGRPTIAPTSAAVATRPFLFAHRKVKFGSFGGRRPQNVLRSPFPAEGTRKMNRRRNAVTRPTETRSLDRIDKLILKGLQADGRKSVSELAREVHLTTSPCLDRVRRLEKEGYIRGYTALLNPHQLGARILAFVEVRIDRTTPELFQKFRAAVESLEEVVECHMVAGGFDYLIKIRVADMEAYRKFLGERLATLPGIAQTHTYVAMEELKSTLNFKF